MSYSWTECSFEVGIALGCVVGCFVEYFIYNWFVRQMETPNVPLILPEFAKPRLPPCVEKLSREIELEAQESCEWLNTIIAAIVVDYLGKESIEASSCKSLNKALMELTNKTGAIDTLFVKEFNLGETLPLFKDCTVDKLTEHETKVSLDIYYDGGIKLQIYAEVVSLNVLLSVTLVEFSGALSVSIRDGGRIAIGFEEEPHMVFNIKFKAGAIGSTKVANFISSKLKDVIRDKLVYPNMKVINMKAQDEKDIGILRVEIVDASNLPAMDSNGFSDPFCRISGPNNFSKKTKTVFKTLNPVWNEVFSISPISRNDDIRIAVFDYDKFSEDDFIGYIDYPLYDLKDNERFEKKFTMKGKKKADIVRGHVKLAFTFIPSPPESKEGRTSESSGGFTTDTDVLEDVDEVSEEEETIFA
eukprot:Nk52_evm11s1967 gene=Nk52_evmTU11s1967